MIADLTDFTLGIYGTLHCVELQKLEIVGGENPCHAIGGGVGQKAGGAAGGPQDLPPGKCGTDWFLICWKGGGVLSKLSQEEVQSLRSRICHGEQGLISTLTPEQFLALLSYDYDTGFAAGKASAQKEILCMLAADGMPPEKIALLLRMEAETVREILAAKRAHIEKCRKKLEQEVKP